MRGKTSLVLIEICVMLLVLALAAGLCLQVFAWAELWSRENSLKDGAMVEMQSTAEALKHFQGDFGAVAQICGGNWDGARLILEEGEYIIAVVPVETDTAFLRAAQLTACREDTVLAELTVCWQEAGNA